MLEYSMAFRMSETQKLHVVKIRAHKNRIGILVITEKQLYKGHKLGALEVYQMACYHYTIFFSFSVYQFII